MVNKFVRVPWVGMVHKLPARVLVTFGAWPQLELNTVPPNSSTVVSSYRQNSTYPSGCDMQQVSKNPAAKKSERCTRLAPLHTVGSNAKREETQQGPESL